MRLRFLTSALLLLSLQTFAAPRNEADTLGAYLSRMDMLWDNDITADPVVKEGESHGHWGRKGGYYSGAIMGNGLLGTNFYELEDGAYRLNVGRSDVTEMRKPFNLFNSARLPIGYFRLKTVGNVTDEKMRLSIYDATATGRITTECGALNFRTYVHSCVDCIVFETEAEGEECGYEWSFVPQKAISPRAIFGSPNLPKDYLNSTGNANPEPLRTSRSGVELLVQPLVTDSTMTKAAGCYVVAWKVADKGAKRRVLATVSYGEDVEKTLGSAVKTIRRAAKVSEDSFAAEHVSWWHDFYKKAAFLTFPDSEIEKFWWFQYYKFASTARPGKPIVDLQGVWPTYATPWPAVWLNLNIQLTYSWLTKANLGFLAQPLWDSLWEHRDNLTRNVTDIPGQESWAECRVMPRGSSYDLHNALKPQLADVNQYEVGNLTWTIFYWWEQCLAYGDDRQMKERLFPILKSAVNIFYRIRITEPDGTYSLPSTASPEYFTKEPVGKNANYDLANLRWGLQTLIALDEKYSLHDPMRKSWEDFLDHLAPFGYSPETGFKISDEHEFIDTTHRHYSHLFMIYPYRFLDWDNPEDAAKMQLSMDRWHGNKGYYNTGKASMYESRGDGDSAYVLLKEFFAKWMTPNTLYHESGPVIETPLSAMCSLEEMYLQDWKGYVHVFPACPSLWRDAEFRNMRAAGAFLVSAVRHEGRTELVSVCSEKGGECRIRTDIPVSDLSVTTLSGKGLKWDVIDVSENLISIPMHKGETVVLSARK